MIYLNQLFKRDIRSAQNELLNQYEKILQEGIKIRATVLRSELLQTTIGGLQLVALCLKFQQSSHHLETWQTSALVPIDKIPQKDQEIRIMVLPSNRQYVVVL